MSTVTNWNAKISVTIEVEDGTNIADLGSNTYDLRSCQSVDPQFDSQIEPQHSINNENIGYLVRPTQMSINLGVLASISIPVKADGTLNDDLTQQVSDSEVILWLQGNKKEFSMRIQDYYGTNKFKTLQFRRCRVGQGRPGTITPDGQPVSNWTIRALEWDDPWA